MRELEKRIDKLEKDLKKVKKDKKVIKKILRCFFGDNRKDSNNSEIKKLKMDFEDSKKEIIKLKNDLIKKEENINSLLSQIEKLKNENRLQKINFYYDKLSQTIKNGLDNILRGDNEIELFANALINFDPLWEYAKHLNQEHKDDDFRFLKEILEIVFEYLKNIKNYSLLDIKIGDKFDMDSMVRDNRSLYQNGSIEEIVLFGYRRRDKIIQKAIVRI